MKKYASMIVSFVLLVTSLVFAGINNSSVVSAGAGSGTNTEVKTMEDVYSVLDYISNRSLSGKEFAQSTNARLAEVDNGAEDVGQKVKHSSATLTEETVLSTSYDILKYSENESYWTIGKSSLSLTRSLSLYMTDSATFYTSKGSFSYTYSIYGSSDVEQNTTKKRSFTFDMEIYVSNDVKMIKFHDFNVYNTTDDEVEIYSVKPAYRGKWIQVNGTTISTVVQAIDSANQGGISQIKSYIERSMEKEISDFVSQNGFIYKMTEALTGQSTEIVVDLGDAESPTISFELNQEGKENNLSSQMTDVMTFSNLDNTVINLNGEADYVFKTDKEFDMLVNIIKEGE